MSKVEGGGVRLIPPQGFVKLFFLEGFLGLKCSFVVSFFAVVHPMWTIQEGDRTSIWLQSVGLRELWHTKLVSWFVVTCLYLKLAKLNLHVKTQS